MILPCFSPAMFMPEGGGGAFNPASLVGSQGGFWRADIGVSLSGANVTAWGDQSALGNNLAVGGANPVFSSTGFNTSFPGITFTAGLFSKLVSTAGAASINSTTLSLFMLLTPTGDAAFEGVNFVYTSSATNEFTTPALILDAGSGAAQFEYFSTAALGNGASPVPYTLNVPNNWGLILNGSVANAYKGFTAVGSTSAFSSNIGAANSVCGVGTPPNNARSNQGFVAAYMLLTNNVMAAGDITNLKNWTNSNWGTSF